ncbi:2-keto-4-pentenoate hydratase/2-oxohepta-3-ene-1,7-dioic acid hydratase [Chthonomonas calidirosea]|uniref:2-keto-4-pentenoate hydratase/2-oxohepta-3-ene-1,7-dioic acid hydratase (Catechol pathway) n=1 Tax=Chthonomonas calidirosea (strain DSM 23976 / ICMP 18418 / T49) TaxID=1303518 RepID=S0EVD9_CHTCT|nr:fumarylacetoacetate hydrolase family protein [Chthonomonas calidirosea]CCW35733.1 2-keto-4-pentenoate hydratase/2-oxohepta-3-ene-1,7-dioic acid hydratase (catechol pathway) [Chthonomonas calidirosea T49]CEK19401.1 2-keto-4-pentenoate hydratase/2-oxohepta-3-ene-1,7-dioic acid hydratase [Chthonomonas calidirosea]
MKLVRFRYQNAVRLGVLRDEATVIPLSVEGASMAAFLAKGTPVWQYAQQALEPETVPLSEVQLLAPIADPPKILCVGQNYRDHCEEQNQPIPERPILFSKYATAINDPEGIIPLLPGVSNQIDYEAELAVVIGRQGRNIPEAAAMDYVAGYLCANDVTARDIQYGDKQWVRGKTPDGFFPIGPYLVTADEIPDPHDLPISLTLNGQTMQSSNTSNLIFRIPYLISYFSRTITLQPGDILSTGTPGGVGVFRKPPVFLKEGDVVEVTIQGLGTLRNVVRNPSPM